MLLTYSDSDFAGDLVTRKSTTGVFCFLNGGPVAWSSRRQDCVSLSSTEAEYVAASAATKTVILFRQLLDDIEWEQTSPTTLLCDNQGAISLVKNSSGGSSEIEAHRCQIPPHPGHGQGRSNSHRVYPHFTTTSRYSNEALGWTALQLTSGRKQYC